MSRNSVLLSLGLFLVGGCGTEHQIVDRPAEVDEPVAAVGPGVFETRGTLKVDHPNSAVLTHDNFIYVGAGNVTCGFDVDSGVMRTEDSGEGVDFVEDVHHGLQEADYWDDRVLVSSRRVGGLMVVDEVNGESSEVLYDAGVLDAKLTDDGVVALVETDGACQIAWWSPAGITSVAASCAGQIAVDPMSGLTWLAAEGTLTRYAAHTTTWRAGIDVIEWDSALRVLYGAGSDGVVAYSETGERLWRVDQPQVQELAQVGTRGAVAALDAHGQVFVFDAQDGARLGVLDREAAIGLAPAQFGDSFGVLTRDHIRVYGVLD